MKLSPNEQRILETLAEEWDDEMNCYPFAPLMKRTNLDRRSVRLACRSLKRKGLAEFYTGLTNLDGEFAGAGYCASRKGAALIYPCDVCGELATYSYNVGLLNGEICTIYGAPGKNVHKVLECEEHYKKSPNYPKV